MTPNIIGADDVVAILGLWPSFHDAEILSVHLIRGGESTVTVEVVDRRAEGALVTFSFRDISDLSLDGEDADHQNVIQGLYVEDAPKGTKVLFAPCYGLCGHITAKHVSVKLEPRGK